MEKRKRGRPGTPQNIEEYVIIAALKNPGMKRLALVDKVENELKEKGFKPPGKDKMLKLFQKAPKPGDEDKPWNLAKSVEYHLSPEATGDLLRVWAFCLAAGREFTIRQAKWACYLRNAPYAWCYNSNKLETVELYNFSVQYANRERICQALRMDIDTTNIDLELALTRAEFITALKIGLIDKNKLHNVPEDLPQAGINRAERLVEPYWPVFDDLGIAVQSDTIFFEIPGMPEEAPRVFAYWLRFISKTPKWETLSLKEKQDIALKLKNDTELAAVNAASREDFSEGKWVPIEILKALGCEDNENQGVG